MDPPAHLRNIVDTTALFVAENGPEFEKRILANEAGNRAFDFLPPGDPLNAYYRRKVGEFRMELQAPAPTQRVVSGAAAEAAAAAPPEGSAAYYQRRVAELLRDPSPLQRVVSALNAAAPPEGIVAATAPEGW